MSDFLSRFDICQKISEPLKTKIRLINVFNDCHNRKNVFFITQEDRVFAFGANGWGVLGFGHELAVEEPTEVRPLSGQRVTQLFFGNDFALALTGEHVLLGWGANYCGQLGRGVISEVDERVAPTRLDFFGQDKLVRKISCGYFHSLVLTEDGHVFGWGWNQHGQVGSGSSDESVPEVTRIQSLNDRHVTSVQCAYNSSLALTADGLVFVWGDNSSHQLGMRGEHYLQPTLVAIQAPIQQAVTSLTNTYFLAKDGRLFFCGEVDGHARDNVQYEHVPKEMEVPREKERQEKRARVDPLHVRFTRLDLIDGKTTAMSEEWVFSLKGARVVRTKFKSLLDFYSIKYQLTHETHNLSSNISRVMRVMARAFDNRKNADVVFRVKRKIKAEEEEQWATIHAHKWFLEENSEYFSRMFCSQWKEGAKEGEEGGQEVLIQGYSYEAFYEYLRWIYTSHVDTQDMEVLVEMLSIAETHLDHEFKRTCVSHVKPLTDLRNACSVYSVAVSLRAEELERFCFQIMADNVRQMVKGEDFRVMDSSMAKHFFAEYFKHY